MRYFLFLSYQGTNYHGWQIQKNAKSVQEVIDGALATILRNPVKTIGSGRTDAGVHAREQVLHFDTATTLETGDFVYKMNSLLPKDIAINDMKRVVQDAHARFSAHQRQYHYIINTRKDPFLEKQAYYFRKPLDLGVMNDLEDFLLSWKDYQSFSRVKTDVDHFLCDILQSQWTQEGYEIKYAVTGQQIFEGHG